jgi:PAS domain S-box-containing protein/putative nucleotidyltransferase with HDIG domain
MASEGVWETSADADINPMGVIQAQPPTGGTRRGLTLGRGRDGEYKYGWLTVVLAGLLFAAILAVRAFYAHSADATLVLFVLPIALCAVEFGVRGGLAAAAVAFGLLLGWDLASGSYHGLLGLATRGTAYLLVGGLLGRFVDGRHALEAKVERHYDLSRDLFCTATFDGYFEELNPAWEQTLGRSKAELRSRPFIDWVHPADQKRTLAETAKLADTGTDTVSFRNRYLKADGGYVWLEWNASPAPEDRRIYATARDITPQKQAEEALQNQSDVLERSVRERTRALQGSRLETLQKLAIAAEYRDDDTRQHTERVGRTAALIARELGFPDETVALIRRAAPLHDIGKVGVPDSILLKPGKLSDEEFEVMKEHVEIGAKILAEGKFAILQLAQEIALTHHERWDGAGYPNGLRGEEVPAAGRIVAVADVFDALTHERPYKHAWPVEDAVTEIGQSAGGHFDPRVAEAFAALDHDRLLDPVEDYDLDLPSPPLSTPSDGRLWFPSENGAASATGASDGRQPVAAIEPRSRQAQYRLLAS